MLYRLLGNSGLKVSLLSFGSWITFMQLTTTEIVQLIQYAFEQGINLFDTAEVYGEGEVENKLGKAIEQLSLPREKYILSSKVFWGGNSQTECGLTRKHIIEGCHRSLTRLKVNYLDLYLCHRPDPSVPILETVIAMNILIQQGKILYWGTSEWPNELIIEAYYIAQSHHLIPSSIEQFEYNLLNKNKMEMSFPAIQDKTNIGVCTTMPLASGLLAGRYNQGIPVDSRANLSTHDCFKQILTSEQGKYQLHLAKQFENYAKKTGIDMAALALAWCISNQRVSSVIFGSNNMIHLKKNLAVIELLNNQQLPPDFFDEMNTIFGQIVKPSVPTYEEVIAES